MRRFVNKSFKGGPEINSYGKIASVIMKQPVGGVNPFGGGGGMTVTEMKDIVDILPKLDDALLMDDIVLEETEWNTLKSKINSFKWQQFEEAVITFMKDVENAVQFEAVEEEVLNE